MAPKSRGKKSKDKPKGFEWVKPPEDKSRPSHVTAPTQPDGSQQRHEEGSLIASQCGRTDEGSSSTSASDHAGDEEEEIENTVGASERAFLHHSNSSVSMRNVFAPPFYNRPPTPLPPSPSLTSLLRPPFSTTTSRPTTPDSSDNDTPNDTESAVTKSARIAQTVPRASPKVPTYEYYGFVLYLLSSLMFRESFCRPALSTADPRSSDVLAMVLSPFSIPASARHSLLS